MAKPDPDTVALLKSKLNSDRIEYFFGNYGVEPIKACADLFPSGRISDLYSKHDQNKIMRTLAMVDFVQPIPTSLQAVRHEIDKGASIGIALRNAGWQIVKKPIYFGEIAVSKSIKKRMQDTQVSPAAVHIYQLAVKNSQHPELLPFCTIIEIHSSDYLDSTWLKALYPEEFLQFHERNSSVNELLRRAHQCMEEIQA